MEKEEFQKKYDNSILVCCIEYDVDKIFNICDSMGLTASKSKQVTAIDRRTDSKKAHCFHVEQFFSDFYKMMEEKEKNQPKEPTFKKGNPVMYTIEDENGNTYAVTRLSERVYESKEYNTLFITDEEGIVTGIYKEE